MKGLKAYKEAPNGIVGGSIITLAKLYVKDYGIDGEKKPEPYEHKGKNIYSQKKRTRLFCQDCPDFKKCKGKKWPNCENAECFFEVVKAGMMLNYGRNAGLHSGVN